ncbi:MAG: LAGLIDADG family homing endonuclease, partial [Nanoarchaeota archaeon]
MDLKTKQRLKKFVNSLAVVRGRHTELVSVYIPAGYELVKIIGHLKQEQGTASNIKDARTRQNVTDSLERMVKHLQLFKRTPENGLAVFAGNVSKTDNKVDIQVYSIEPPEPLKVKIYRCDQTFYLDLIKEQMEHREVYGLIVMDKREASIGYLRGTSIRMVDYLTSGVPGKTRAGGQCLTPDTLIQSAEGDIFEIAKSHNPHVLVGCEIEKLETKNTAITDKWNTKKDKVYKIITKYPRIEIESSKDHVFFVRGNKIEEKSAEDLRPGDYLLMPEKMIVTGKHFYFNPIKYYNSFKLKKTGSRLIKELRIKNNLFQKQLAKEIDVTQTEISLLELGKRSVRSNLLQRLCQRLKLNFEEFINKYTENDKILKLPIELDEKLALIIGYFLGDGNFEKERVSFSEYRKELAEYYEKLLNEYFNANTNLKFRTKKNYWQIRAYGKPVVKFLQKEFPELRDSGKGFIPKKILESNEKIISAFLRGLFDAEGYCSSTRSVGLGMNNKKLIQQLQMLLLRFGILCSFVEDDNKNNPYTQNHRFAVDITEGRSLELFNNYIGFTASDKKEKLKNILDNKSKKFSRIRRVPILGSEIKRIIEEAGHNLQIFPKVSGFFNDKRMMSKQVFYNSVLKIARKNDQKLYEKLNKIYNYNLLPVKIKSIEVLNKETEMIDISTKQGNFIANCLLVHNSSNRFARLREEAAKEFYYKISDVVNKEFLGKKEVKGIILGGPGPTKEEFSEYLNNEIRKKVIGIKDVTYTDESGLHDLVEKSQDLLANEVVIQEKIIMTRFFEKLGKEPNKIAYGINEVKDALNLSAVDIVLVSEDYDEKSIEELESLCEKTGAKIQIISTDTREGKQLKDLGGVGAILRYEL